MNLILQAAGVQDEVSLAKKLLYQMRWKMYGQKVFLWSIILILSGLNIYVIYNMVEKHQKSK